MADTDEGPTIVVGFDGEVTLKVEEVWPDGPPDTIDAHAVVEAMHKAGRKMRVVREWGLDESLRVDVTVTEANPAYAGDDSLPGLDAPAPFFTSHVQAWAT